jgi:hypothetical protein
LQLLDYVINVAGHVNAETQENAMKDKHLDSTTHDCSPFLEPSSLTTHTCTRCFKVHAIGFAQPVKFNGGSHPAGRRYVGKGVAA